MTIRTGLDMAAKRCGATLHDGVGGSAHVGGQGMALLIGRKGVLEDRLERDERHRCLRTRGRRASSGGFVQYHANYPRCKRLVQQALSEVHAWRSGRVGGRCSPERPARFTINGWTYCAAFLASCVFCWSSCSSSAVRFGGTSL